MKKGTWAVLMATVLILAIVVLAFLAAFLPTSQVSEWKIEFDGLKAQGTSLLLGFAVVLLAVLILLWPTFRKLILGVAQAVKYVVTQFLQ